MHFLSFLYSVATAFVGFFTHVVWGVIVDWWALPVGERVGKFLGFTGALAALLEGSRWIGQRIFKSRTRLEQHIEWLELEVKAHLAKIDEKQLQLEAISRENAELLTWYPLTARKAAERERRDGNDESEARILTEYLVKITPDIAAITRALTQFHIAFSIENPQLHLAEARRYGDISGQLDLGNEESHDLMATVTRLHSEFQVERLIAESERPVADQIAHELGIDLIYSPETRIDYLREVGFALSAKGLIRAAYLFVDRAARYAAGKLPPTHGLRATTECWAGVLQANVGEIRSGWNRFEKAWPVVKDKLGARSNLLAIPGATSELALLDR